MEIPAHRWFDAIFVRTSRRQFDQKGVEQDLLRALQAVCTDFRPFPGAKAAVLTQSPEEVFKGAIGPYGKVKGAPALLAFIGDMEDPNVQEEVGYLGEALILEATALDLATCWVGGFFRPQIAGSLAGTKGQERVLAVSPVGHAPEDWSLEERIMSGFGRNHGRKSLAELVTGLEQAEWTDSMKAALQAARLAPSAVNRQPWRFHVDPESITVSVNNQQDTFQISKRLDCGIAMLHLEVALRRCGLSGRWTLLEPPGVARFQMDDPTDIREPVHPDAGSVGVPGSGH